jgi:septation ring formation regulator EzrA
MRNKDLFEQKLERFEAEVKKVGYLVRRNELDEAYERVGELLEKIGDLRTLLNTESQD